MKTYLYWIHLPEHTDIFSQGYVGITSNISSRFSRHKNKHTNPHLSNTIDKYNWENLIKDIVIISHEEYCLELEKKIRPEKEIGWNIAIGGGKPVSPVKGEKLPKWICERISNGKKGVKFSETHKKNLAKAKTGKSGRLSNNFKHFTKATNIKTNEVFILDGAISMSKLGLHDSAVYRCLKGEQKSHNGYVFERVLI